MQFGEPCPNGQLEILYQLIDENPSYYKEKAKERQNIIQNSDPKDFKSAFNTLMNSGENNILRCISVYTINKILETKKINSFLLQTRNDYLPLYLLDNLNFHENIETKSRFNLSYPDLIDLGYPSISRLFLFLYNLNPTWPELVALINENPPVSHYILVYFSLNMPLSVTIPAFEGLLKNIRTLPKGFNRSLIQYKEKMPIEIIAKYIGELKYCFYSDLPLIFVKYHNEIISNKHLFKHVSEISTLVMLLRYGIYTPFEYEFDKTISLLTEHFCVIDGEQRGYSNPSVYNEFRIYMKKVAEMYPEKYKNFLNEADETVLSAFSFEYDENVLKRVFENSYCPWVYVVLFHEKIPKSIIPWDRLDMYEPAPDLVNSIKLYNGIDENLMKEYLDKMSVVKFVYLFHDYYDCKSIPDLKNRLLNFKHDFDPMSIFYDAIYILGDAVDVSQEVGKYIRYGRLEDFVKLVKIGVHISKEDAKSELNGNYSLNMPLENWQDFVLLVKKMLSDYPELVDEYKEKLENAYYAPLFMKEFIPSYEFNPLDPKIVVMLANTNGAKSLTNQQVDVLLSLSIKDSKFGDEALKAVSNAIFTLVLDTDVNIICKAISGLIEYFISNDDKFSFDEMTERIEFITNLKTFLNNHSDIKQKLISFIPESMENVFDYIETVYEIKI